MMLPHVSGRVLFGMTALRGVELERDGMLTVWLAPWPSARGADGSDCRRAFRSLTPRLPARRSQVMTL